jgi:ABC-2 type transport system ATP-binding protein
MKSIIAPFYKKWNNDCFYNYIKIFELSLKQKIKTFSRGMRLKFALAIALSHDADLIIMDEPTSGLDPVFRRELLEILSNLISDKNKSILFSTHITSDLEQIADYVTFINKGDLVFSKTTNDILKNYGIISGDKELLNIQDKFDFCGYTKTQKGVEVLIDNFDEARIRLKNFKEISYKHANLEDIMYFINKKNKNNDYINN